MTNQEQADQLDREASINEAYMLAMEQTTARTDGRLGHLNTPNTYAAHANAAAARRAAAKRFRGE